MSKAKEKDPYISPALAAARLINFAIKSLLMSRHGKKVRWTLNVQYWYPKDYKTTALALAMGGRVSSGDEGPEMENYLTGSTLPVPEPEPQVGESEDE